MMVTIEGKTRACTEQDTTVVRRRHQIVWNGDGLIENEMEDLELGIEHEEEAETGFVEAGPQELLILTDGTRRWLHLR